MRTTDRHTFFFTAKDVFSNWYLADFEYKGVRFNCTEQFMMYCKAKLFNNDDIAQQILNTPSQKEQKALGRRVTGLQGGKWDANDVELWNSKCKKIVAVGVREKFLQNPQLYNMLMATDGTVLVEASPYDTIWGIGMKETDPGVDDPNNWKGSNWLGDVLTQVREHLKTHNLAPKPPKMQF